MKELMSIITAMMALFGCGANNGTPWQYPGDATKVVYLGDSLAQETADILRLLTSDKDFVPKFYGGTAPCDWLDDDLEVDQNTIVAIQFTGNSITPCMENGGLFDQALVDKYDSDIGVLIDRIRSAGGRVVLVGQPYRDVLYDADYEVAGINEVYLRYARDFTFVSYVDAGASVERDGKYSQTLPCNQFDTDCLNDETVVRGDGAHFCPDAGKNPCPVFSSGALRYGMAIAHAVNNPNEYEE